jgi:transcription-repair coupling factor (superfamily II helicase)
MRIRWIANQLGAEKLVLKSGKMILYFISKQDSPFYQSDMFTRILEFLKHHSQEAKMYEKDNTLRMSFQQVNSVQQALSYLEKMTTTRIN